MTDYVTDPEPVPPITSPIVGPAGRADLIAHDPARPDAAETIAMWLVDAPDHHPAWDQYAVAAVRLRDGIPGMPPPHRQFDGATHELLILVLNPMLPATPDLMAAPGYRLEWLHPANLAHQVIATFDEVAQLLGAMCWAICHGHMPAEPPLGYQSYRDAWATTITKSLAHQRGETHAP